MLRKQGLRPEKVLWNQGLMGPIGFEPTTNSLPPETQIPLKSVCFPLSKWAEIGVFGRSCYQSCYQSEPTSEREQDYESD
jgi:hypothetical protein